MRVLVAGATGALGHTLIPRLARAGHDVIGMTRNQASQHQVEFLGATAVVADVLDAARVADVVASARPDAVVHAAKAIPKRGPIFFRDMRATNQLHRQGTANLLDASLRAGVSRIIVESIVFAYGYGDFGDTVITEDHATNAQLPRRKLSEEVDGVLAMEQSVLDAAQRDRIEATVLRCGLFYGPFAGTDGMVTRLRRRQLPLPGGGRGLWPLAYIDDVADAVAAAVTSEHHGIFNVVDDEPVTLRDFTTELAALAQVPPPWSLPKPLGKVFAPYFTEVAATSMRVSNQRAKTMLGWIPAHRTYREGLAAFAATAALGHDAPADDPR